MPKKKDFSAAFSSSESPQKSANFVNLNIMDTSGYSDIIFYPVKQPKKPRKISAQKGNRFV